MDQLKSLGIDLWSILLYILNTGVLLAVLTYFFYKPLMRFVDERRDKIKGSLTEADRLRDEFAKELSKLEKEKADLELKMRTEMENLNKFVEKKRTEMVADMEAKRSDMLQKAQEEIEARKAAIINDAEQDVKDMMTRIILDIVQNKVPENVISESIQDAWATHSN